MIRFSLGVIYYDIAYTLNILYLAQNALTESK